MNSIIDDIKRSFTNGNALTRTIYINLGVFVLVNLVYSLSFLFATSPMRLSLYFGVPASLPELLFQPWTLITYMFYHEDFMHILFNMLYLYFGGRIFMDLLGEKRLISTYILGGFAGAALYILAYNIFPAFNASLPVARAIGASASILAIIAAIATKVPNYQVNLIFLGPVKLKYIALVLVVLDLISFRDGNAGGHLAHLGGAIFGFFYIKQLDRGKDWSLWYFKWANTFKSLFKTSNKKKIKVVYQNKGSKKTKMNSGFEQETVDKILDKISKSGYDSLSKEEKDILFKASQKH